MLKKRQSIVNIAQKNHQSSSTISSDYLILMKILNFYLKPNFHELQTGSVSAVYQVLGACDSMLWADRELQPVFLRTTGLWRDYIWMCQIVLRPQWKQMWILVLNSHLLSQDISSSFDTANITTTDKRDLWFMNKFTLCNIILSLRATRILPAHLTSSATVEFKTNLHGTIFCLLKNVPSGICTFYLWVAIWILLYIHKILFWLTWSILYY